ncbi:MAG: response regulator [Bacteroidetes bacterium]|nr:response regulator [Bacteroidota bacterium]
MDTNSNAKIIQAVFGFLEAVNGKRDTMAISALIRGMIDELLLAGVKFEEAGDQSDPLPWSRLDHDLRSPMNGILGFTEILLEELTDPELKWKAEQIHVSALRLMQLLDNSSVYRFSIPPTEDSSKTSRPEEPSDALAPHEIPVRKKAKSAGKKLPNVLIVEDNMVNSNLLQHHIRKYCHIFFSQTGNAAIEVAKREKIDAIFMDINLGQGIDGTQAMLEIRKQIGNENIPVVAVTGFAGREDRHKFLKAGFDEFIAKPFERQEVISIIESLFKQED